MTRHRLLPARVLMSLCVLAPCAVRAESAKPAIAVVPDRDGVNSEFDRRERRDPFRPPRLGSGSGSAPIGTAQTPLERYELGQLRLVALIYGDESRAVVEDDQGIGYIVKIGTRIGPNGGEVARINPGRLVVHEEYVDFYGEKRPTETVLEMKTEERKPGAVRGKKP